jgi:hypothetical protein
MRVYLECGRLARIIIDVLVAINVYNYIIQTLIIIDTFIMKCFAAEWNLRYAHVALRLSSWRTVRRR